MKLRLIIEYDPSPFIPDEGELLMKLQYLVQTHWSGARKPKVKRFSPTLRQIKEELRG
jgi:hypothetical protein